MATHFCTITGFCSNLRAIIVYRRLQQNLARVNRIWPAYVAGWSWHKADTVCIACHSSGSTSVDHGEILLEYGTSSISIEILVQCAFHAKYKAGSNYIYSKIPSTSARATTFRSTMWCWSRTAGYEIAQVSRLGSWEVTWTVPKSWSHLSNRSHQNIDKSCSVCWKKFTCAEEENTIHPFSQHLAQLSNL